MGRGDATQDPSETKPPLEQTLVAVGLIVVALLVVGRLASLGPVDDAYIYFRFARNLAAGLGACFNPGDGRVEGFSSPLWLAGLTLAQRGGLDLPTVALGFGAAAIAVSAALGVAGSRVGPWGALPVALVLALTPSTLVHAQTGLDEPLFVLATILLAVRLLRHPERPALVGAVAGLAVWVRLEAGLVWLPWALFGLLVLTPPGRGRIRALAWALAGALPFVAVELGWRLVSFGSWLPNPARAKVGADLADRLLQGAHYLVDNAASHTGWILLTALLAVVAAHRRERRLLVVLVGVAGWLGFVVLVGGDHFALGRFLLPALALATVGLVEGLRGTWPRRRQAVTVWGSCGVVLASCWCGALVTHDWQAARHEAQLARQWAKTGRWLAAHEPADSRMAVVTAGALPYFTDFRTLDLLGLVTPEIAWRGRLHRGSRPGHQRYDTDAVVRFQPDLIVYTTSGWVRTPRWRDPRRISTDYSFALKDALLDPRVASCYRYEAHPLADGTWIELSRRICPHDSPPLARSGRPERRQCRAPWTSSSS